MEGDFLVVDYKMSIEKAIKLSMSRSLEKLYDHITVTKNNKYYGIVTVKDLIEKSMEIEVGNAMHLNPLTGLPGNILIEQYIEKCITLNSAYSILYFDLDNFKAYNDIYGFESGDMVIKSLSKIIIKCLPKGSFLGHIGGDDFIAIIYSHYPEDVCKEIINEFNSFAPSCYNDDDKSRGYIIAQNRNGVEEKFPLLSVSIAGLTNKDKIFVTVHDVSRKSSKIKCKSKAISGSSYVIV